MVYNHFQLVVIKRIEDHKAAEQKRLEAQRERIRAEEEAKAAAASRAREQAAEKARAEAERKAEEEVDRKDRVVFQNDSLRQLAIQEEDEERRFSERVFDIPQVKQAEGAGEPDYLIPQSLRNSLLRYMEEREDIRDGGDGLQLPNEEMSLAVELRGLKLLREVPA